jgi:hypothetical protein
MFWFWTGVGFFSLLQCSQQLGHTHYSLLGLFVALFPCWSGQNMKLANHLHLMWRWRMPGLLPLFLYCMLTVRHSCKFCVNPRNWLLDLKARLFVWCQHTSWKLDVLDNIKTGNLGLFVSPSPEEMQDYISCSERNIRKVCLVIPASNWILQNWNIFPFMQR